jgi:hypothetical protein
MSDNEVIVTIEPSCSTSRPRAKALGNVDVGADLKPSHPTTSLISQNEGPVAPVMNGKRVLP